MRRIRQGIDLIKLALAVQPQALIPLMLRRSMHKDLDTTDNDASSELDKEELEALTRGDAPFELRLRMELHTKERFQLESLLVGNFVQKLDMDDVNASQGNATTLRKYLVARARATPSASRLIAVPVPVRLIVKPFSDVSEDAMMAWDTCPFFSAELARTIALLHEYQHHRVKQWDANVRLAPFIVEHIELDLRVVPLTDAVVHAVLPCFGTGIPVSCPSISLDYRHVWCQDFNLQTLLEAATEHKLDPILLDLGSTMHYRFEGAEFDDDDHSNMIVMIFSQIGRLSHEVVVEIGSLFMICRTLQHRITVISGLIEFVLSRDHATHLSFQDSEVGDHLANELVQVLDHHVRLWRENHPGKKLRLKSLNWSPIGLGVAFVLALLRALDDVEEVELEAQQGEELRVDCVKKILSYPSLRILHIDLPVLPSMDIFITCNRTRPTALALEGLTLSGVLLADAASLTRFIETLDPRGANPNTLSRTLKSLTITETDEYDSDFDEPEQRTYRSPARLAITDPGAPNALGRVLEANKVLQYVNFLGDFSSGPIRPAQGLFRRLAQRSHIPAPVRLHGSAVAKARAAAFLSAIRDGDLAALRLLDSNVIRVILTFAAPHVDRIVHI